jgi:transglutaminase-like putative cysteine protease
MQRREFLKVSGAAAVGAALPWTAVSIANAADGWREFEVTTEIELIDGVPAKVWVPMPLVRETVYFRPGVSEWKGSGLQGGFRRDPVYGANVFYGESDGKTDGTAATPKAVITSRFATRDRAVDLSTPSREVVALNVAERELYLQPTEHVPTDGIVGATARKIMLGAGPGTTDKARAIYEWIVDNTYRNPKTRGCGTGDIRFLLESGDFGGKCADLNALFVGLARASGIPARDVYGVRVATSKTYKSLGRAGDITKAQHCRAEFYHPAYGWVPVDPADVRKVVLEEEGAIIPIDNPKVAAARAKLFGAWEMNWLPYNTAMDLVLPSSASTRVNFLMYPYAETPKGKPDPYEPDFFSYKITSREIVA